MQFFSVPALCFVLVPCKTGNNNTIGMQLPVLWVMHKEEQDNGSGCAPGQRCGWKPGRWEGSQHRHGAANAATGQESSSSLAQAHSRASDRPLMLALGQPELRWLAFGCRRKAAGWDLGLVMALNVFCAKLVPLLLKGHFSIPLPALKCCPFFNSPLNKPSVPFSSPVDSLSGSSSTLLLLWEHGVNMV